MSIKLNAGEVSRSDNAMVYPQYIEMDENENGRTSSRHSQEEIEALARNILAYGQEQAIVVRKIEDHRIKVVAGYGRLKAFRYINEVLQPDNPLKVRCEVKSCNAEEAFVHNLNENLQRAETGPIDDAHNQRRLKDVYGWTDERIADFYKCSVQKLSQLRKVLQLSGPLQEQVSEGKLPLTTALEVVELPEAVREEVVQEATKDNGKVDASVVKNRIREVKNREGKGKARSLKEVKFLLNEIFSNGSRDSVKEISRTMQNYLSGLIDDGAVKTLLDKYAQ